MGDYYGLVVLVGVASLLTTSPCDASCSGTDGHAGVPGAPGRNGWPGPKGEKGEPGKCLLNIQQHTERLPAVFCRSVLQTAFCMGPELLYFIYLFALSFHVGETRDGCNMSCLTFVSVSRALLSQCDQNVIQTTCYMCLLLNGVNVITATQTKNAWFKE